MYKIESVKSLRAPSQRKQHYSISQALFQPIAATPTPEKGESESKAVTAQVRRASTNSNVNSIFERNSTIRTYSLFKKASKHRSRSKETCSFPRFLRNTPTLPPAVTCLITSTTLLLITPAPRRDNYLTSTRSCGRRTFERKRAVCCNADGSRKHKYALCRRLHQAVEALRCQTGGCGQETAECTSTAESRREVSDLR